MFRRRLQALDSASRAVRTGVATLQALTAVTCDSTAGGDQAGPRSEMLAAACAASPEHNAVAMDVLMLTEESLVLSPQVVCFPPFPPVPFYTGEQGCTPS